LTAGSQQLSADGCGVFASVLFFVGLSSKLPNPKGGPAILVVGIIVFIPATVLTFPIEV